MLTDLLKRLFTPCSVHLRELGLPRELAGIRERFQRFGDAWRPHCDRSKKLVGSAIARCERHRRCLVIGSSWLHDVPLAELAGAFDEVVLLDLLHPLAARWEARRHRTVRLVEHDITAALEHAWAVGQTRAPLGRPQPALPADVGEADLTVSLNLLSQLPCMPERYLQRRRSHSPANIAAFSRHLVEAHLAFLRRQAGVVTLIADVEMRTVSQSGELVSSVDTLYGAAPLLGDESWDWALVPRGDTYPHHSKVLRVVGVTDLNALVRA
jgi:hypothetical protein